jgi:hypothetical protein
MHNWGLDRIWPRHISFPDNWTRKFQVTMTLVKSLKLRIKRCQLLKYAYLFRLKTETAALARPLDQSTKVIRGKSVHAMDCGALQTIISSLIICKDLMEKVTIIETANGEENMISNHV